MKAAVLDAHGDALAVKELPEPRSGDRDAVVRVRATGICGTDLKLISGALPGVELPLVPGHEVAGELVEPVDVLEAGARVACSIYETCGRCRWCRSQRHTLCPRRVRLGLERDGGLAEYVAVPRQSLLPFSASVPFAAAAVTMDAVAVPWAALHRRGGIEPGEQVAVIGAGGLGLHAIQIAHNAGCLVATVDPLDDHRALALELGAELALPPEEAEGIQEWAQGGVDLSLETSGTRAGFDSAAACLRRGGRVVCCGYYPEVEYGVDSARLVLHEIDVKGSVGASIDSARAAVREVEKGAIRPVVTDSAPLDEVNAALERLAAGEVLGRIVIEV
jgi:D-arabinose 1-dehydrogenase-like Zn-dependent alcohol dehydrogenase